MELPQNMKNFLKGKFIWKKQVVKCWLLTIQYFQIYFFYKCVCNTILIFNALCIMKNISKQFISLETLKYSFILLLLVFYCYYIFYFSLFLVFKVFYQCIVIVLALQKLHVESHIKLKSSIIHLGVHKSIHVKKRKRSRDCIHGLLHP